MNLKEIEDFYPLSPMQEGMLFHSLYAPEVSAYINTFSNGLQGAVNVSAFQHAWQQVVNRHQALRSIFVKDGLKQPLQFVYRQVTLPWEVQDWRELSPAEQQQQLNDFLLADRARGFDLSKPPLMRFALLRLGDDHWQFIWTFHHILLDGWCLSLLLREVFGFYEAYTRGQKLQLPRPRPYRDYIGWLQRQDLGAAETYWRKRLQGISAPTTLDFGDKRQDRTNGYGEQSRDISEQTSRAVESLARQQQVTVNTVIQGAWALLMSRYSGERDVLYGVTVSGRPAELAGVEQMVGLFINALPMRVEVESEAEVGNWLQRLQAEQAEMRQYEYSPLVQVQGWSEVERGVALFETLLAYENFPTVQAQSGGGSNSAAVSLSVTQGRNLERTNYPLSVVVTPGACMNVRAMYEEQKFDAHTVSRMLRHFEQLLAGMAANVQQPVSRLQLLTEAEERQLLVEWNSTQTAYPQNSCVHELIEAQVSQTPDAIAVVSDNEQITYAELNAKANQLAHHLQSLGVGPDVLVGICVERSIEMLVGLLGIWKAGGAYVAIDPSYPQERLGLMLSEIDMPVLLTQHKLLSVLPEHSAQVVSLDSDWPAISQQSEINPGVQVLRQNLAYVIYTSGSTGTPKGAGVYHQGLVNTFNWFINDFQITADDRILLMTSLSFDLTQKNIFTPLMAGGTLYLTPVEGGYDPVLIADLISEHQITLLNCTPSAFYPLVDNGDYDSFYKLVSLRHLFLGGEPISIQRLSSWTEFYDFNTIIVNTYGPTECTDIVASYCLDGRPGEDASVPIGKPIFNAELFIVDRDLNLLPVGVAGELCIGGDGVGAGYINDSRLTAAKFVPHPFSSTPGARLYRTGDRARYLADGNIEFLGRSDHQIKIRGFRIEIGEIETALNAYPGVRESVVVVQDEASGDKRLVAFVVTDEERLSATELRKYLASRIPEYMVPSSFVQLDQLPLTPNGKVDRRALASFEEVENEPEAEVARARNPVEELLIGIWKEVLGVKQLGISDNFFDLGGHSLVATQVISRISETFKIELPFRAFFDAPTIEALAIYVEDALRSQHAIAAPPLVAVGREQSLPLSFSQQRLWFLDQLEPNSNAYNIPSVVRLRGPFIPEFFKQAVEEVMRRHESLRTRFVTDEGRASQEIVEAAALDVPVLDLSQMNKDEQAKEVRRLATLDIQKPFDLTTGPLLRLTVVRLAENEHVLMLTMHHIVSDGWSMTVLMRELIVLYHAFSRGESSPLPELTIQYADYAVWQREWLQEEVLEQQMKYWREQLQGAPPVLELPTDHPRPAVQSLRGRMLKRRMPGELLQQLEALSRREGLTMYMSVLAAFVVVLARYSGEREIVVGTPIAGRTRREIEGLIGFFVNTLVLRTTVEEQESVRQLLERVRETCLGAYTHQDVAFEQLVEELQPERDLSHQPLFQVMFAHEGGGDEQGWKIGDLQLELEEVESDVAKFDLSLRVKQGQAGWELAMEYKQDLYEEATIARMLEHVERVLEGMAADVRQPVRKLELLSEAEQEQLLKAWNETDREYEDEICVQQLFEARAAERGGAVALVCEGEQVSYGELNRRSNQLAHYLRDLGVGPEVVVGLCMDRSVEMVVGLLGILKAGGAYLPLDPEYPQQRLSFMLDDADVTVVITQERLLDTVANVRTVSLDRDWTRIAEQAVENPEPAASSANLAYVIYTSGSTGIPKGVMLNHKGLTNRTLTMIDQYGMQHSDRQFQFISLSFDASVEEIFPTLCCGAALVLRRNNKELSATELLAECGRFGVTKMDLPVSYWHQMADELSQSRGSVPESMRVMVVGGDSPSTEKAKAFMAGVHHPMQVFNAYGPTEATVLTTLYEMPLNQDQLDALSKIPIGRPINNTRLYILDADLKAVPARVFGELYIGGEGLARGYLNRPEFSAEKFIPNLFSDEPGTRLYRTGDVARYLPNGDIEFAGRIDQQVKVRGFRIELSEIENLLLGHPAIAAAAVSLQERESAKSLVAYIVPHAGPAVSTSELRRYLQQHLPEYMVPSMYMVLEELPLTPNGKVDRKSLPVPDGAQPEFEHEYIMPQNEVEEILAGIWAKMLGVERVGIHDNFFELGGDSILSIQVISRANQAGLRLSPKDLFQHQTVAKLAAVAGKAVEVMAEQGLVTGPVSLTPIQRWFFEQEVSERHHFNQSLLLEVREAIDPEVLGQAVRHLVLHHDALRLRFEQSESGWNQYHADARACAATEQASFSSFDLSTVPASEQSAAIEAEAAVVQASLHLSEGPLLRVVYFELGAGRAGRLLLVCHHLVVDGVSWRILLADLQEAYRALAAGEAMQLAPKSSSFQQWSQALTEYASSAAVAAQAEYWLRAERERVRSIPRDYAGENLVHGTSVVVESLSREETEALLQEVPGVYHTQINEVLLSGLALALGQWTESRVVLVDVEGHGREQINERVDVSRTVGWFTTIYPVLLEVAGNRDEVGEVVKQVKEQVRSIPGQGLGYGVLRYLGNEEVAKRLRELPHAEVSFNYLGQMDRVLPEDTVFGAAPESSGPYRGSSGRRMYLLEINAMIAGGRLQVSWSYSSQIHRQETIAALATAYVQSLRAIIEHCTSEEAGGYTPSDFPLAQLDKDKLEKLSLLLQDIDKASLALT